MESDFLRADDLDIKDSRLYDYLIEQNEQESTEEEYSIYDVDSAWKEDIERWRD